MKTLVVGNSLDALPIIQEIFSQDKESQITLFTTEGVLPYDRTLLPALVVDADVEKHLFKAAEIFLSAYHPHVVTTETLTRISVKRRYLTTEKKAQINYD